MVRVLTIAGSDSGGGAGIQADLKTFAAHGVYGASAVTAVTAQNTVGVAEVVCLAPRLVAAQIGAVIEDIGVDAIKIGMLGNGGIISAVAASLEGIDVPVVLDPVMVAKSGAPLLEEAAACTLVDELLPLATLVTPNLPEMARLAGQGLDSTDSPADAARRLAELGPAVLLKGGHGHGEEIEDLLWRLGDSVVFRHPRVDTPHTHGTGCTLSAAVAARLARGEELDDAVSGAIDYVQGALRAAPGFGAGHGPLDHLYQLRKGRIA